MDTKSDTKSDTCCNMRNIRICGIVCLSMIIMVISIIGYYGYQVHMECQHEFIAVSAQVIAVMPNPYPCSYLTSVGNGCVSAQSNTPKCSDNIGANIPGICDNGYKCCQYHGSSCIVNTEHQSMQVNTIQCYLPEITYNLTFPDGYFKQLTQQKGTCGISSYGISNPVQCMNLALDGFFVGQIRTVYYIPPNYVQSEFPLCPLPAGYVAGIVLFALAIIPGMSMIFCNCSGKTKPNKVTPLCVLPFNDCCNYCMCCKCSKFTQNQLVILPGSNHGMGLSVISCTGQPKNTSDIGPQIIINI